MTTNNSKTEKEIIAYKTINAKLNAYPKIVKEYYQYLRDNNKSYTTITVYINNLLHFYEYISYGKLVENFYKNITSKEIENYMLHCEIHADDNDNVTKIDSSILQQRWTTINGFFTWLLECGYLLTNPISSIKRIKTEKIKDVEIDFLTEEEIENIFYRISKNTSEYFLIRDRAFFKLAICTGVKTNDLTNLNVDDFDINNRLVYIRTKKETRKISIGKDAATLLSIWLNYRNKKFKNLDTKALFISRQNTRLTNLAANNALKKYCDDANIKKNITLESLRKSVIYILNKKGVLLSDIAEFLGVSSITHLISFFKSIKGEEKNVTNILDRIARTTDVFDIETVSIKRLLAYPENYIGKEIMIEELMVISYNNVKRKYYYMHQSTGERKTDFITSININVFYDGFDSIDKYIMLDVDYQKVRVCGKVHKYSNNDMIYIAATQISGDCFK